jgi:hypothetical protein
VAGGDRVEAVRGEGDRVADWRGRLVSDARARESEGECGWQVGSGRSERQRERVREREREREHAGRAGARGEAGRRWAEGEGDCARGEGEAAGMGRKLAQPVEERFLLFFLFSFSIFISFISFPQLIN